MTSRPSREFTQMRHDRVLCGLIIIFSPWSDCIIWLGGNLTQNHGCCDDLGMDANTMFSYLISIRNRGPDTKSNALLIRDVQRVTKNHHLCSELLEKLVFFMTAASVWRIHLLKHLMRGDAPKLDQKDVSNSRSFIVDVHRKEAKLNFKSWFWLKPFL
jgi:hypothetical protein